MKVCKESKIRAQNEYVTEILRERNLKVINDNETANKVTRNKTLMKFAEEFIISEKTEMNEL